MFSSRMHTAHSLQYRGLCPWGMRGALFRGLYPGGSLFRGVSVRETVKELTSRLKFCSFGQNKPKR